MHEHGTFTYMNPTTIEWGAGSVAERLGKTFEGLGATRVFLVTTRSVVANSHLMDTIQDALGSRLVGRFGEIGQHAPAEDVSDAARAAREGRPDAILSFGGGSPIDAAKAVALNLATGIDPRDPQSLVRSRQLDPSLKTIPHVAIPTTLSGAELAYLSGFSAEGSREKLGFRHPALVPRVVFYDATLTVPTPLDLWLGTGIRAVDHAVEGIISSGQHPYSDTLALEGLRRLKVSLTATRTNPADLDARTQSQLGAWFSYTLPLPSASGLSHTLGKRLGSVHGIPHGVTSCLLLPHVMRYLAPTTASAQAVIAGAMGVDVAGLAPEVAAARAADAVQGLIAVLGLPNHLATYKLSPADLDEAVRPLASPATPADDLRAILRAAW